MFLISLAELCLYKTHLYPIFKENTYICGIQDSVSQLFH